MGSYALRSPRFALCFPDRGDDVRIGAATTKITAHPFADFAVALGVTFLEQGDRGTDLPGGAVAALKAIVLDERCLHRMQLVALGETLNRNDLIAFMRDRETEARIDPATVHEDSAGPALPVIATLFRAGQIQTFA